jgi:hypothetical protein
MDKRSTLLRKFINYGEKSFITLAPGVFQLQRVQPHEDVVPGFPLERVHHGDHHIKLFSLSLLLLKNKLGCLSLAGFFRLEKCL